jgi:hypothetical protein
VFRNTRAALQIRCDRPHGHTDVASREERGDPDPTFANPLPHLKATLEPPSWLVDIGAVTHPFHNNPQFMHLPHRFALCCLFSIGSLGLVRATPPDFGPNVKIFDPSMPTSQIQATVDAIANQQVDNQFGTQRYALLFMPGTYGSTGSALAFQVGYYTEVAGLGASPTDVTINGHVDSYNQCFGSNDCIALDNFWRSLSNLTINVTGLTACRVGAEFWAVSQAAPMRRVNITGGTLTLFDYCSGPSYASGGFISDSQAGTVINGSQQQFLVRNSSIGTWTNGVWNQVFSGVVGAPAQSFPSPTYTTLEQSPVTREKPFLYVDSAGNFNGFVPASQTNSVGTTWGNGPTLGSSIPITNFFTRNTR